MVIVDELRAYLELSLSPYMRTAEFTMRDAMK